VPQVRPAARLLGRARQPDPASPVIFGPGQVIPGDEVFTRLWPWAGGDERVLVGLVGEYVVARWLEAPLRLLPLGVMGDGGWDVESRTGWRLQVKTAYRGNRSLLVADPAGAAADADVLVLVRTDLREGFTGGHLDRVIAWVDGWVTTERFAAECGWFGFAAGGGAYRMPDGSLCDDSVALRELLVAPGPRTRGERQGLERDGR
jgi:hypothetical protein